MTNEEFQRAVLEKLGNLEAGQKNLEGSVSNLEKGQRNLEVSVKDLEVGQKNLEVIVKGLEKGQKDLEVIVKGLEKSLGAVIEQTADLTEFREEVKDNLNTLLEENLSIHGILGEHEVAIRTIRRMII